VCLQVLKGLDPNTDVDLDEVECIVANLIFKVGTGHNAVIRPGDE